MASRGALVKTTAMVVVVLLLLQHQALAAAGGGGGGAAEHGASSSSSEDTQYRRHRRIRHRNAPQTPTPAAPVPPVQPVRPPPPPPPALPYCNDTFAPEESLAAASGDVCVPRPARSPPAPPVVPPPRQVVRCPPCTCPRPPLLPRPPRPFPGWPGMPVPVPRPVPGTGSNAGGGGGELSCVEPIMHVMPCQEYLTSNDTDTPAPTPNGDCCSGLATFVRTHGAAAGAGGRGDFILQCLCPFILGDVNKVLPKPVDPVRMMFLPIACGVVLPPQLLPTCFVAAGQMGNQPQQPHH